ncbi:opioid growth factor receptor conserved region-domain-containing protein [Tuber brumale]|nr:opioid growth factor receptor conserved region-domain-containing protein [Tuber brumale]
MHRFLRGGGTTGRLGRRNWLEELPPVSDSAAVAATDGRSSEIVRFYTDQSTDHRNRTLSDILSSTNSELERSHDYIQTLFPLPEPSPYNPLAPTIDPTAAAAFRSSLALRLALRSSLLRMLSFYGFDTAVNVSGELVIRRGDGWSSRSAFWRKRFNHNHLRITRIIRCLRVLGCEGDARRFYRAVSRSEGVGGRSLVFWRRALRRGLEVLPEDEDEDGAGGVLSGGEGDMGDAGENSDEGEEDGDEEGV